jgi:hypothetical protein
MAGAWVRYLDAVYGPASQWRPELAHSFSAFSTLLEMAGAAMMFLLVARWLKRAAPGGPRGLPARWGRWEVAALAAIVMWLNPASIVDSQVWPHGQTWLLPFYLAAVLGMISAQPADQDAGARSNRRVGV